MKQVEKQGKKNEIGAIGEKIAENYLKRNGFEILETNYLKKWGEIDIISRETRNSKEIIHFVEVKTVSYETKKDLERAVSYGTWKPEDNVHYKKLQRMVRTLETWIAENNKDCVEWQIDVAAVRVVAREKYATIKFLDNVIVE